MPSRGWYFVAVGLVGTALAIAITGFMQMRDAIGGLQRVVMPGRAELTLAQGRATLYVETRSLVGTKVYVIDEPAFTCALHDVDGRAIELRAPRAAVSYTTGDFTGHNALDIEAPAPGVYTLECTADHELVIAVGGGITAWVVVAIVGGLVPGIAGVALALVLFVKRRKAMRRQAKSSQA